MIIQDLAVPLNNLSKGKSANWSLILRDLAADMLPDNMGKILSHKMLPTPAEQKAHGDVYHKYRKPKSEFTFKKVEINIRRNTMAGQSSQLSKAEATSLAKGAGCPLGNLNPAVKAAVKKLNSVFRNGNR